MKLFTSAAATLGLLVALTPAPAAAQSGSPLLHVNSAYSSCFFDLHPELTQAEFEEFTGELGSVLRFRQLGDVAPLGRGHFDIGLHYTNTPIDDSKGAWNNTMSHPTSDHELGDSIAFPRIVARLGVSDRVDVGAWGGFAPDANYGILGAEAKFALMTAGRTQPWSLAIRPSIGSLVGPDEVWVGNASIDIALGRTFGAWSPYVGVGTSGTIGVERSNDVDLDPAAAPASFAYAGISYSWRALVLSAEAENAQLNSYAFRIGTKF